VHRGKPGMFDLVQGRLQGKMTGEGKLGYGIRKFFNAPVEQAFKNDTGLPGEDATTPVYPNDPDATAISVDFPSRLSA
jgi:hypothetical protein